MDFSLTEEQTMLADSVARFIENDYSFETRMKTAESDEPFNAELRQTFAEMGWTAMLFDEADGGFDGGPVELMILMEQFGRGLVVEPFLANVVLAGGVIKRASQGEQREALLSGIIDGSHQAALAFAEPHARFDISDIQSTAEKTDDGFRISGKKTMVLNAGSADTIIIPARTSGEGGAGITLFAVPSGSDGLRVQAYKTVDAQGAAELELDGVLVPASAVIGSVDDGFAALKAAVDDATLAV